jgi:hypothetical protein
VKTLHFSELYDSAIFLFIVPGVSSENLVSSDDVEQDGAEEKQSK